MTNRFHFPRRKRTVIQCIAGEDSLASLYEEYQKVLALPKDDSYDTTIEQDLPRTFPQSGFLKKHLSCIREVLDAFVSYSSVGYIQGQNFLAAASVFFFFGRLPYMSFWLMVSLFENLKHIYLLPIDATFRMENKHFAADTEKVVKVFLALYRSKHAATHLPMTTVLILKNMVQWRLLGTLMLTFCKDLTGTRQILFHYVETLEDRDAFRRQAAATALAFLVCCFLEKEIDEEVILVVQNASLTETGLDGILQSSENLKSLL